MLKVFSNDRAASYTVADLCISLTDCNEEAGEFQNCVGTENLIHPAPPGLTPSHLAAPGSCDGAPCLLSPQGACFPCSE